MIGLRPALLMIVVAGSCPLETASKPAFICAAAEVSKPSALRDALLAKLKTMNDADDGIFHDDVTDLVAPYFPKGQPLADTARILREQKLGPLRLFHGKPASAGTMIYVSHGELVSEQFTDVYVTLDFVFAGKTQGDLSLEKVTAFIQSASM